MFITDVEFVAKYLYMYDNKIDSLVHNYLVMKGMLNSLKLVTQYFYVCNFFTSFVH